MPRPTPVDLRPYFLTLHDVDADYSAALDWPAFFGNDHPVEIDVGSGRGLFLVSAGTRHAGVNYLGIELDYREGRRAARRLQKREMPNVRVLGADVNVVFAKYVEPHSVAAIHVYFPDPWWKKKHRRRRVFTDAFVDQCARLLAPGGLLHSRTDVGEYFEIIAALMNHHPEFEPLPPPPLAEPQHDMDYTTSFERKKRKLGLPIFRGVWRRRAIAPETSSATHPSPPPTPQSAP
jgi:tRNA (guanine-N7-)-methyltransferase